MVSRCNKLTTYKGSINLKYLIIMMIILEYSELDLAIVSKERTRLWGWRRKRGRRGIETGRSLISLSISSSNRPESQLILLE